MPDEGKAKSGKLSLHARDQSIDLIMALAPHQGISGGGGLRPQGNVVVGDGRCVDHGKLLGGSPGRCWRGGHDVHRIRR